MPRPLTLSRSFRQALQISDPAGVGKVLVAGLVPEHVAVENPHYLALGPEFLGQVEGVVALA